MIENFSTNEIKKELHLADGTRLILLDRMGLEAKYGKVQCARNLYLLDISGKIVWQVSSDFDYEGAPFTNVSADEEGISAYRWDGGTYVVEIHSGFATPKILAR